jgi:hypothetical protein
MTATQISPIDRLSTLSAQRTARTDRLHEATQALLALLEPHVEAGTSVRIDGCSLGFYNVRSNVGTWSDWSFGYTDEYDNERSVDIDRPVGAEGYVHGDFNCEWRGPTRANLIAFASRADRFVAALIAREEKINAALATAQTSLESAAQTLT